MELREIQKMVFEEYIQNGYKEKWASADDFRMACIAELGLVVTEVSEAIEEVRNQKISYEKIMCECADIIIRVLNFVSRLGGDIEPFIIKKHEKNLKRGEAHGRGI